MKEKDRFGERLRELREQAGLSRQELAERAGLKMSRIRDLEQGVNIPRWDAVVALSRALGVSCEDFLEEPARGQ